MQMGSIIAGNGTIRSRRNPSTTSLEKVAIRSDFPSWSGGSWHRRYACWHVTGLDWSIRDVSPCYHRYRNVSCRFALMDFPLLPGSGVGLGEVGGTWRAMGSAVLRAGGVVVEPGGQPSGDGRRVWQDRELQVVAAAARHEGLGEVIGLGRSQGGRHGGADWLRWSERA